MKSAGTHMGRKLLMLYSSTSSRREYIDALAKLIKGWIGCGHIKIALQDSEGNVFCESAVEDSIDISLCEKWAANKIHREKVLGVIHLANDTPGKISANKFQFIETVVPMIGEAVHRFNLEDELAFQASLLNQVRNAVIATNVEARWTAGWWRGH